MTRCLGRCLAADMLHHAAGAVPERLVDQRQPLAGLVRIATEVLVLDSTGLDRQKQKIACPPVYPLAVHDRVALTLDDKDDQTALMAMLAGMGGLLAQEPPPAHHRCVLEAA